MQRIHSIQAYPYSSIVGTGILLFEDGTGVVGQLSLIGVVGTKDDVIALREEAFDLMELGLRTRRNKAQFELPSQEPLNTPVEGVQQFAYKSQRGWKPGDYEYIDERSNRVIVFLAAATAFAALVAFLQW